MARKIIAVDFDGTLCENKYPLIGKPKDKVIDYIKSEQDSGATIILWTCRAGMFLKNAVAWCEERGIKPDYVNENEPGMVKLFTNDCRKIFADVYLDDKAMHVREIT